MYADVLHGRNKNFPTGVWENQQNGVIATKHLIEKVLGWSDEEVLTLLSPGVFRYYGLGTMLKVCFGGSMFKAMHAAYPNKYKTLRTKGGALLTGNREDAILEIKNMLEESLMWSRGDICDKLQLRTFTSHKCGHLLTKYFDGDPFQALDAVYPNAYKLWEVKHLIKGKWTKDLGIEAIKWLVEEKLQWSPYHARQNLSMKVLRQYGLIDMIHRLFEYNIHGVLNTIYPE